MIAELKNNLYVDIEDMNFIAFNVTKYSDEYNLDIQFGYADDDTGDFIQGLIMRTSLFVESLQEVAQNVQVILDSGLYDHLGFIDSSTCFDINGDVLFDFEWDDYFTNSEYESTLQ